MKIKPSRKICFDCGNRRAIVAYRERISRTHTFSAHETAARPICAECDSRE